MERPAGGGKFFFEVTQRNQRRSQLIVIELGNRGDDRRRHPSVERSGEETDDMVGRLEILIETTRARGSHTVAERVGETVHQRAETSTGPLGTPPVFLSEQIEPPLGEPTHERRTVLEVGTARSHRTDLIDRRVGDAVEVVGLGDAGQLGDHGVDPTARNSATRDGWEHSHLISVADRVITLGWFTVAPDVAGREEPGKGAVRTAVGVDGGIEHLADVRPTECGRAGAGSLSDRSEQTQTGHGPMMPVEARIPDTDFHRGASLAASDPVDTVRGGMLNLLLARHGQSEWNAVGRWQGQEDPPLSELGRAQARGAASHAGAFDALFASDLERALHTATIISNGIGVGPVIVDPRLKERFAGEYQGLTRTEIEERFPGQLDAGVWPPHWEDDATVLTRVMAALADIVEHTGGHGDVLAVSHGGVIYTIEGHFQGSYERIENLGGRWLHYDGSTWRLGERIQLAPDNITIDDQDIV